MLAEEGSATIELGTLKQDDKCAFGARLEPFDSVTAIVLVRVLVVLEISLFGLLRYIRPFTREVQSVDSGRLGLVFSAFEESSDMGCGRGDSSEKKWEAKRLPLNTVPHKIQKKRATQHLLSGLLFTSKNDSTIRLPSTVGVFAS